jgi:hypothetical protein
MEIFSLTAAAPDSGLESQYICFYRFYVSSFGLHWSQGGRPLWSASPAMKILAWNCRGLAQPFTVRSLRAFLRNKNPNIVFLTKTKSARHVASPIL